MGLAQPRHRFISVLQGLLLLTAMLVAGELISTALVLPLNGGVSGMLLLILWLLVRGEISDGLLLASEKLISQLVTLILPAVVGIFFLGEMLVTRGTLLLIVLLPSTLLSVLATLLLIRRLTGTERRSGE